jgi:hypothetical protein
MAKGIRLNDGQTLVVYSTKVSPETRALMDALARANGIGFGQRLLLEEMIGLYQAAHPDKAKKAQALLEIMGELGEAAAPVIEVDFAEIETRVMAQQLKGKTVQTIRYAGRPQVHLAENGKAACGLAGQVDPDSLQEDSPEAVDCKKCRYCRKAVFA